MTIQEVKNFRNDFQSAITELQEKYGVNINAGTIRYSDNELRFKVTARKGKVTPKLSKEAFQIGDKGSYTVAPSLLVKKTFTTEVYK